MEFFFWFDRSKAVAGLACFPIAFGAVAAMSERTHTEDAPQAGVPARTLSLAGVKLSTATVAAHAFLPHPVARV
jgi:hypothetical protein